MTSMKEEGLVNVKRAVEAVCSAARKSGVVLTIEQRPTPDAPLAMGNHVDVVSVRPARVLEGRDLGAGGGRMAEDALGQPAARAGELLLPARGGQSDTVSIVGPDGGTQYWYSPAKVAAMLAAAGAPAMRLVGYMSPKQLHLIADPPLDTPLVDAFAGKYIPVRKTAAGNFTLAIYVAAPTPTDCASTGLIQPQDC